MVYIDTANKPYGRMIMCHMIADSTEELIRMASEIGVNPKWIQKQGTYQEHFDVCLQKKKKALLLGAKEITEKELVSILLLRKDSKK